MKPSVAVVSLGCAKNLVDAEVMVGLLEQAGYRVVDDVERAEAVIVNTCAFIQPAVEEAVEALLELSELKRQGCRALICAGCLPRRYGQELADQLPEVDAFLGPNEVGQVAEIVAAALAGRRVLRAAPPQYLMRADTPRRRSGAHWLAHVKIAEGCDHRCGYCLIPHLRGRYRSRPASDIAAEVRCLIADGVQELCLIAQDTSAWGRDLRPPATLSDLLWSLDLSDFTGWVRLQYLHPTAITDALLETVAALAPVVPYFDLPLQHADQAVLRAMRRPGDADQYLALIERIRSAVPEAALRTTFIVGHPGETDAAFSRLLEFVGQVRFDRLSAFRYWPEEGTASAQLPDQVPVQVAEERLDELMAVQQEISLQLNRSLVGRRLRVLVEGMDADSGLPAGRSYRDAPEVDGQVLLRLPAGVQLPAGQFVEAIIEEALDHDLIGRVERL